MSIRLRDTAIPISSAVFAAHGAPACVAQDTAPPGVAVVRPTDNAFDALLQAGAPALEDASTPAGKIIAEAEGPTATLTQRVAASREPAFRAALAALRDTIARPIGIPYLTRDETFRYEHPVRRLARLLAIEQYVLLSQGKVPAAIDSFADSLTLADAVQHFGLSGVGVGEYVADSAVQSLANHQHELIERDCIHLLSVLRRELDAPNPALEGVREEGHFPAWILLDFLQTEIPKKSDLVAQTLACNPDLPEAQVLRMKLYDPTAWLAFEAAVNQHLTARAGSMADRMSVYPPPTTEPANSVETSFSKMDQLANRFSVSSSMSRETENRYFDEAFVCRTHLQLLAVHAALLRSRWETNAVPESLSALNLGALATDIFTGQPLSYARLDPTHYSLASIGPVKRDENFKPRTDGKREPVTLIFRAP